MEKVKPVGIWVRVSTEEQAKGESPEHHEKRARFYAESKGLACSQEGLEEGGTEQEGQSLGLETLGCHRKTKANGKSKDTPASSRPLKLLDGNEIPFHFDPRGFFADLATG